MKKLLLLILLIPSLVFASPYNGGPVSGGGGGGSGGMVYPGLGIPQSTGAAWGVSIVPSADVQTFLGYANFAAMRTGLSLVPGTNVQAYDPDLTIYAGITPSANVQTFLGYASFAAMKAGLSIDDAFTAMGIADGVTTLGTFTGSTIPDSSSIKTALQALETSLEAGPIYSTQTATCTDSGDGNPGTLTLQPNTGVGRVDVELTVNDSDGCTITMGEVSSTENQWVRIVNVSAANTATFATSAGVLTLKQGTPFVMGTKESLDLKYINSEWLEQGRVDDGMSGSFTSIVIPNSDDPDTSTTGQVSFDTDGWLRVYNNARQEALARTQEEIHVTVYKPQDLDDAQRDHFWIWSNESGMSFIVTGWKGWSTSDDTSLAIMEEDSDGQNDATVDAVEIATDGTSLYYGSDTTITGATIENGHMLYFDFDDADTPALVKVVVYGYYNADVN